MNFGLVILILTVAQCVNSQLSIGGIPPGGAIPYPHPGLGLANGVGRAPFLHRSIPPVSIVASPQGVNAALQGVNGFHNPTHNPSSQYREHQVQYAEKVAVRENSFFRNNQGFASGPGVSVGGIPPGGAIPYPHPGLGLANGVGRGPFLHRSIPPVSIVASPQRWNADLRG